MVTCMGIEDEAKWTLRRWSKPQSGIKRVYINHPDVQIKLAICPNYNGLWNLEYTYKSLVDFGFLYHWAVIGRVKKDAEEMASCAAELALIEYLDLDDNEDVHQITFEMIWKNAL